MSTKSFHNDLNDRDSNPFTIPSKSELRPKKVPSETKSQKVVESPVKTVFTRLNAPIVPVKLSRASVASTKKTGDPTQHKAAAASNDG